MNYYLIVRYFTQHRCQRKSILMNFTIYIFTIYDTVHYYVSQKSVSVLIFHVYLSNYIHIYM